MTQANKISKSPLRYQRKASFSLRALEQPGRRTRARHHGQTSWAQRPHLFPHVRLALDTYRGLVAFLKLPQVSDQCRWQTAMVAKMPADIPPKPEDQLRNSKSKSKRRKKYQSVARKSTQICSSRIRLTGYQGPTSMRANIPAIRVRQSGMASGIHLFRAKLSMISPSTSPRAKHRSLRPRGFLAMVKRTRPNTPRTSPKTESRLQGRRPVPCIVCQVLYSMPGIMPPGQTQSKYKNAIHLLIDNRFLRTRTPKTKVH